MKLRAAVGVGVLLMCLGTITCTRQTPGNPSSNQANQPSHAENQPPNPAPAPTVAEETKQPVTTPAPIVATPKPAAQAKPVAPKAKPVAPVTAEDEAPAAPAKATEKPMAAQKPSPRPPMILPAGTTLTVRTSDTISAKSSEAGQTFQAVVAQPVVLHGHTVIPAGAPVTGRVVQAHQGGKIKGESDLALQLTSVRVRGASYPISTGQYLQQAKGKGKRTTVLGAGGAGVGALIGGLAGGGKGALIGGLAGGGAGVAGGAMTGNKELKIPAESVLPFKLTQSLRIEGHAAQNPPDESKE